MLKWLLALLFSMLAAVAVADETERPTESTPASPVRISSSDATAIVRQAYGGRVVSTMPGERTIQGVKRRGYWVRVDVDGRVKKVFVDVYGRIHADDDSAE